jgi:putative hydrolase of the HAD superfamily
VQVAVVSNSDGRLAELLAEIGIADAFGAIVDSGVVGIAKPDPRIFAHALHALGAERPGVHVGDSWAADVEGAVGAGWRAIWYAPDGSASTDPRVPAARDAGDVRRLLGALGI